ncbi:MAG: sigma-70 family RNA polymerase sigma factor [Acidobacteriota bacterium]
MSAATEPAVTDLLARWAEGDRSAADDVLPLVYDELRSIAERYLRRERRGHTLQATAIVHEAYVQLIEQNGLRFENRAHFIGFAARVLRRVLVLYARERNAGKRGGRLHRVTLVESAPLARDAPPDLVALDDALTSLASFDRRKARIVELRFFGGLSGHEIADLLGIGTATVSREWRSARAWLFAELSPDGPPG